MNVFFCIRFFFTPFFLLFLFLCSPISVDLAGFHLFVLSLSPSTPVAHILFMFVPLSPSAHCNHVDSCLLCSSLIPLSIDVFSFDMHIYLFSLSLLLMPIRSLETVGAASCLLMGRSIEGSGLD